MEINVKKIGKVWTVQFTHKAQTFTLDYHVPTEEEAQWMKSMLAKCFTSAFGENWNKNNCNLDVVSVSLPDDYVPFTTTEGFNKKLGEFLSGNER
jgi:hypothetical protein